MAKIGPKEAAARAARSKKPTPKKAAPKGKSKPAKADKNDPEVAKFNAEIAAQEAAAKKRAAARAAKQAHQPVKPPKAGKAPKAAKPEAAAPALALPEGDPAAIIASVAPAPAAAPKGKAAKAPKAPKPPKDWTVKPVIKSETNKAAQQLIDRIEAASFGDDPKKALTELLGTFKPCNTYYKMAHRYGTALLETL